MANAAKGFGEVDAQDQDLTQALKEWAIAITALHSGSLILLLRKGGIRDPLHPFGHIPLKAALFPTYEHQVPHHLKHPIAVTPPPAADAPVTIETWAQITHGFSLSTEAELAALMPFHLWTAAFMTERLKWRSPQPIQALLLRAYRWSTPNYLERSPAYVGCRSWIDLTPALSTQNSTPALPEEAYQANLKAIEDAMQTVSGDFRLKAFERS